jgi:hypothetical protein
MWERDRERMVLDTNVIGASDLRVDVSESELEGIELACLVVLFYCIMCRR